jgi:hypothetical protein
MSARLLFPVNETKPRLVKIPWKMGRGDEEYHDLDTDIWFKSALNAVRPLFFHQWGINGPELGRGLCLMYDDNFSMNGSPLKPLHHGYYGRQDRPCLVWKCLGVENEKLKLI